MDINVNLWAVFAATVVQFVVGAVWYMALFAKQWGEMFDFDKLPKEKQREMQKAMGPFYGLQIVVTFITSYVLAYFITAVPGVQVYLLAALLWIGFVVPTQVSAVIFGGVEPRWIARRISIMAAGSLACLLAGAYTLQALL